LCDTDYVQISSDDIVMQGAHVSFDAILFETWGALLNGAQIEVIQKLDLLHPERLAAFLECHRVSIAVLTTSLFNLAAQHSASAFSGLRYLLVGGEVMDPTVARQVILSGKAPGALLNGYGPTETTTFATVHRVSRECVEHSSIPIGRPIRRATCYLLDRERQPVTPGEIGEIWIGGAGVSAGYWELPNLTAERFWPDPWTTETDGMMYATGDLGRLNADGSLEFLGRRDGQVKIRGFRVEVAESERILREHAGVADVAVVPERDGNTVRRLVAFVQWKGGEQQLGHQPPESGDALLEWMRNKAAFYLVPSSVISLVCLPRTSSGKLDRNELGRILSASQERLSTEITLLQQSPEEEVRAIWRTLLRRDSIPANANFFNLGGDSLEAVKMLMQVEPIVGRGISLGAWLEHPTIESLLRLGTQVGTKNVPRVYLIEYLFWLDSQDLGELASTMLPFGEWGKSIPESSVELLAQNCLARLDAELENQEFILVGYSMAGFVAVELARALTARGFAPQDVWLVDSVPPTGVHRAMTRAACRLSQFLRLPDRWQLQMGRVSHSAAEVLTEFRSGRPLEALRRMSAEARIAAGFLRRKGKSATVERPDLSPSASRPDNFHAMCVAHDAYTPSSYSGPVACFLTEQTRRSRNPPDYGWGSTLTNVDFIRIPGTHGSCIREDRPALLAAFRTRLAALKSGGFCDDQSTRLASSLAAE